FCQQARREPGVVVLGERLIEGMAGVARLDQDFAPQAGAPGASGDLLQLGEGSLARAVVAGKDSAVGVEHPNQGEALEMVALGEDLGPDQDVGLRGALEQLLERGLRARCIAVDAQNPRLRELLGERKLDALRSAAEGLQILVAAFRAGAWN